MGQHKHRTPGDRPPVLRENNLTIQDYFHLAAAVEDFYRARETLRTRLEHTGHIDDMEQIYQAARKVEGDILASFSEDKQRTIRRMRPYVTFKVIMTREASKDPEITYVLTNDLARLTEFAHEKCELCIEPTACRRCELGRLLDHILSVDRMDGSWMDIDLKTLRIEGLPEDDDEEEADAR